MIHHKATIGLDLGAHSAKIVRALRGIGGVTFGSAEWIRLPVDLQEQRRVLRSFIEKNGLAGSPAVVSLRGRGLMLHTIEVDPQDPRSIREIVNVEVMQIEGLADEETVRDYMIFRGPGGRQFILLTAVCRRDGVDRTMLLPEELGLAVADVVPGPMAFFAAVWRFTRGFSRCLACVQVGHTGSEVVIGPRGKILFTRSLSSGAALFPGGGAAETFGRPASGAAERNATAVHAWISELQSCLDDYASHYPGKPLALRRIVLAGGGALETDLAARVEEATGVKTLLLRALAPRKLNPEVERFGTALGLAAAGLSRHGLGISLFPREIKEKVALQWQKKYWVLSALTLVLLAGALIFGTYVDLKRARESLALHKASLADRREVVRELRRYERMCEALERQTMPFRTAVHNGEVLRAVIRAVAAAKHADDWITLLADAQSYFADESKPPAESLAATLTRDKDKHVVPESFSQVILEGFTPVADLSTVSRMIEALGNSPGIVDADLLGDELVRKDPARDEFWKDTGCRLFAIEIKVPAP